MCTQLHRRCLRTASRPAAGSRGDRASRLPVLVLAWGVALRLLRPLSRAARLPSPPPRPPTRLSRSRWHPTCPGRPSTSCSSTSQSRLRRPPRPLGRHPPPRQQPRPTRPPPLSLWPPPSLLGQRRSLGQVLVQGQVRRVGPPGPRPPPLHLPMACSRLGEVELLSRWVLRLVELYLFLSLCISPPLSLFPRSSSPRHETPPISPHSIY